MNTDWQDFLNTELDNVTASTGTVRLMALDNRASILVSGEDASAYLQALLTQEILLLDGSAATRAAFCNAKGRTYTTATIHPLLQHCPHDYRLSLPADLVEETLKLLRMYVLRRKVELTDDPDWVQIGLSGQPSDIDLTELPAAPLEQSWLTVAGQEAAALVTREDNGSNATPRYSVQGPVSTIKALWLALRNKPTVTVGHLDEWSLSEIEDGLPLVSSETWGHFVPQWINLDLLSAISFKKGCYPGQEVVARMHYLGKPNRRMLAGHINLDDKIEPGTSILSKDGETAVGEVVRSAPTTDGKQQNLLAVIRLGHVNEPMQINGETLYLHHHEFTVAEEMDSH